jgi:hypothetical protein
LVINQNYAKMHSQQNIKKYKIKKLRIFKDVKI